jgi:hypothetical protein
LKETVNREKTHILSKKRVKIGKIWNLKKYERFHQSLISVVNQTRCRDIASRQENYQNFSPSRENEILLKSTFFLVT